jgi:diphthine synthase
MITFIGLGLDNEKDITLKGLEAVKASEYVYLESYTSRLNCPVSELEKLYGKKIIPADRELVEKKAEQILERAKTKNVAFLVIGDPFGATTHSDLFLRAKNKKIDVKIIHNASILNAIGEIGLQLYKFGKTTSLVFPEENFQPENAYDIIKENKKMEAHTLVLLDIKSELNKFMTVNDAIERLLEIENKRKEGVFTKETLCIGISRIGSDNQKIKADIAKKLLKIDFGQPMHSLIVPGKLHFVEEDMLKLWE